LFKVTTIKDFVADFWATPCRCEQQSLPLVSLLIFFRLL